jgi:hypothetical protein
MNETGRISQISMMKNKFPITYMRILIKMVDAISVKERRPSLYSMYFVTFIEEKLRQICPILAGYPGN